jgi:hypothetical protein
LSDRFPTQNGTKQGDALTVALIDASKAVGLEINIEKTKFMLLSLHQNAGQDHNIKTANRLFENL